MTLFWRIYLAVFICFMIVLGMVSYVVSDRQIADATERIIGEHTTIGRLMANHIEQAQAESRWPFENLNTLSKSRDFLFWWIVRTDGAIHLADNTSFVGTAAHDYFPEMVHVRSKSQVLLDAKRQCGIVVVPVGTGTCRWTFWLGFSTRQISQMTREIIVWTALFSGSALAALGVILYFTVRHLTNPIRRLAEGATIIGRGDLTYRVPMKSNDEIGHLARAFNTMAGHLETTTTSVDNLNREIAERERIGNELRFSEERFKTLFEYAPEAYYLHDSQARLLDLNRAAEQLTGYRRDEVIGHSFLDLQILPPQEAPKAQSLLARNTSGLPTGPDEFTLNRKDGSQIIVEITTVPVTIKGDRVVLGIGRDITRRKKAEEELRESQEKYIDLFENANDSIYTMDLTGKFTSFNHAAAAMLGYSEDEFGRLGMKETLTPESYATAVQMIQKAVAERSDLKELQPWEFNLVKKDGTIIDAEVRTRLVWKKGQIIGIQGITRDITERKKAEEALRDSEAIFRAIFDHANDGILLADTVKKTFCTGNNTICQMLGYSLEEIKKLGVTDIHRKEDLPYVIEQFERQVRKEIAVAKDLPVKRKDGSVFYADVNSSLVTLAGRTHTLGLFRDITERKRAEDQIQQDSQTQSALNGLLSLSLDDLTTDEVLERAIDHMISLPWFALSKGAIFLVDDQQEMLVMAAQRGLPEPLLTMCARVPFGGCVCGRAALSGEVEFVDSVDNRHENSFAGMGPHGHYCVPILSAGKVLGVIDTYVEEGHQRSRKEEGFLRAGAAVIAGIIQRKQAESHIWRDSQIQSTLNKLLSLSLEDLTVEEMLKRAIDHITSTGGFALESKGAAFLADDKQEMLVMAAQRGMAEPLLTMCTRVPFGRCTCGRAARSGEVEFVDCVDERHENTFEGIRPHGHYCVPILSMGKVLGVINTYVKEGHRRCQEEEDFLRAAAGVLAGVIERKQAEKQQTELLQQLAKINQELKDFTYTVSHDLRAPVRKIVSFGQLLQESLANKLTDDDRENLEFMIDGAGRIHELIEALLIYSRVSTKEVQFDALDLNQIMDELKSVELAVPLEESNGTISIPAPLPTAQGDLVQIRQLLQNLVSNALKYHKKGVAPEVAIRARQQNNGMVRVEVQDNGIGIEQQYHDKLFVMFRRLHSNDEYEGTGIGLAVCKKIVQRHKGEIGIVSTPGEGSTFWFTLPVSQTCEEQDEPVAASPESAGNTI